MQVFSFTHIGNRTVNQDYATSKVLKDNNHIFILADGMGGYSSGEIAAKVVADAIAEYADQHFGEVTPNKLLKQAIAYANDELYVKRLALGHKEMGAVIVCLLIVKKKAYIAWLGDSRIYVFRDGMEIFQSEQGDTFFLCSDGIHKEMIVEKLIRLSDEELIKHLELFSSSFDDNATLIKVEL